MDKEVTLPYRLVTREEMTEEWIVVIGKVYNRAGPIVFSKFEYEITPSRIISLPPPFSVEIKRLIREKRLIEACDALAKDGMIGDY